MYKRQELAQAFVEGSTESMARALHELGFETRDGGLEALDDIARAILDVAVQLRHQAFLDPAVVREAGNELPRLIRENPIVRVPSHVVLLGRVIALLSGLGRTLEARVNMLQTILPYLAKTAVGGSRDREPDSRYGAPPPPAPKA